MCFGDHLGRGVEGYDCLGALHGSISFFARDGKAFGYLVLGEDEGAWEVSLSHLAQSSFDISNDDGIVLIRGAFTVNSSLGNLPLSH